MHLTKNKLPLGAPLNKVTAVQKRVAPGRPGRPPAKHGEPLNISVTVPVSARQLEAIDRAAQDHKWTRSQTIRELTELGLEKLVEQGR
jgi:hypothetical protein